MKHNRNRSTLLIAVCLLLALVGCSAANTTSELLSTAAPESSSIEKNSGEDEESTPEISVDSPCNVSPVSQTANLDQTPEQVVNTTAIPQQYFTSAARRGTVTRVEYESSDYTSNTRERIIKPAYVYLPYGYDESDEGTRYNILYLMHGWGGTAGNFLSAGNDLVNVLDNMIEQGDIPPVIVVSATFDAENQPQDFSRSTNELTVFHNDFRNDLAVYIEGRFHTYAEGTTEVDFRNSREQRAFAGFSLGAVTTWYEFVHNLDYVKYFVPMSGDCWVLGTYGGLNQPVETTEYLENIVRDGGWEENDFLIYSGIGTDDPIWNQVDSQMQEMLKSTVFTPNNLRHAIKQGGRHDMDACEEYLYNALPIFFANE